MVIVAQTSSPKYSLYAFIPMKYRDSILLPSSVIHSHSPGYLSLIKSSQTAYLVHCFSCMYDALRSCWGLISHCHGVWNPSNF
jgi:hypothetical protein